MGGGFSGGGFRIPVGRTGAGVGGLGVVGLLVYLLVAVLGGGGGFGVPNPNLPGMPTAQGAPLQGAPDPDAQLVDFVGFVVDDVQDSWTQLFRRAGRTYRRTRIVLFTDQTESGCGLASSATGPFYCPTDRKVYLDLGFFRELRSRFHAPGDFAEAYVIAHEFGHHVQTLLGIQDDVQRETEAHPDQSNELSVRLELQADCFAGVWAHSAYEQNLVESGDMEEALGAAAAVGDDRIQRATRGRIDPETFTHGTAAQRQRWLRIGFDSGDPNGCDTFSGSL
jgi:predicted metalloprotease